MATSVHVAVLRNVRPGHELDFEERVQNFFERASTIPGTTGAYLLRPVAGERSEYGILRSFESTEAKENFYTSSLFQRWNQEIADLLDGDTLRRELHGLEAFFPSNTTKAEPPAWKMAFVTWMAVNPAVWICAKGVPQIFGALPPLIELMVVNLFVVAMLTWVLMPLFTKIAAPWLSPQPGAAPTLAQEVV